MLEQVASADVETFEPQATAVESTTPRWLSGSPLSPGTGFGQAYLIGQNGDPGRFPTRGRRPRVEQQRLSVRWKPPAKRSPG